MKHAIISIAQTWINNIAKENRMEVQQTWWNHNIAKDKSAGRLDKDYLLSQGLDSNRKILKGID